MDNNELGTNLAEVGTDCISRQAAIEALYHVDEYNGRSVEAIRKLPPAQPTPDQNGDLWITVPDIDKATRIYVQESKSKFCRVFYEEQEQPERIIHCKDCEWWTKQECSPQGRCALSGMYSTGGWFCGNARRREVTQ